MDSAVNLCTNYLHFLCNLNEVLYLFLKNNRDYTYILLFTIYVYINL